LDNSGELAAIHIISQHYPAGTTRPVSATPSLKDRTKGASFLTRKDELMETPIAEDFTTKREVDCKWWAFSLKNSRPNPVDRLVGNNGCVQDSKQSNITRARDYNSYLALEQVLACQSPLSAVPDERAFIVVHQLIELVFKLMIFDLGVISRTFLEVLKKMHPASYVPVWMTHRFGILH
jgi:Tryptophan 2,3-dioxygenase